MQFQITTDYAIRIIGYLHEHNTELATAMNMSHELGITYQYFMKVINRLKKARLVQSVQGCNGGYRLMRSGGKISLYDIISAMEGEIRLNRCLESDGYCSRDGNIKNCPVCGLLYTVQEDLIKTLKAQYISNIFVNSDSLEEAM